MIDISSFIGVHRIKYYKYILYEDLDTGHKLSYPPPNDQGLQTEAALTVFKESFIKRGINIQGVVDQKGAKKWRDECEVCSPRKEIG